MARLLAVSIVGAVATGLAAEAQTELSGLSKSALRDRQQAVFQQLRAAPDDPALMLEYASVSAELEDYEAAISTLERLLIYDPTVTRALVELGAAYFRLGSYTVAEFYFQEAAARADLAPDLRERVATFLEAIAQRQRVHSFSGWTALGIAYSTNANLGPGSNEIEFLGNVALLPNSATKQDDFGMRFVASATHLYDMGGPSGDFWRTDGTLFALRFFEEEEGSYETAIVRSGPSLSLDDRAFGAKLRPYIELGATRLDDATLYRGIGAGAEFTYPVEDRFSVYADVSVTEQQFFDGFSDFDGFYTEAMAGVAYAPTPDLVFRVGPFIETGDTSAEFNSFLSGGLRSSVSFRYDPGIAAVDRDWRIDGFLVFSGTDYSEPNPTVNPNERRADREIRVGANHTFYLFDDFFAQATIDYLRQSSNFDNFDVSGVTVALSIGRSF